MTKEIKAAMSMKVLEHQRAISIVFFTKEQGWDIVEYANGGASKFKIAEIPPEIPLDRMDEKQQASFIASILAAYDERLSTLIGVQAKPLARKQVRAIYNRIQVGATALPKTGNTTH